MAMAELNTGGSHPPFSSVFVPCTAPESICTKAPLYFFGVAGTCNSTSQLCECPNGYTGADDIVTFNDCHISIAFRDACHIISIVLMSIAVVASFAGLFKLTLMWGVLSWQNGDENAAGNKNGQGNDDRSEIRTRDVSVVSKSQKPVAHISLQAPSMSSSAHTSATVSSPPGTVKTLQHYATAPANLTSASQQAAVQSPLVTHAKTIGSLPSPSQQSSPTRNHAKSATGNPPSPPKSSGRSTLVKTASALLASSASAPPLEQMPSVAIRRESTENGGNSDDENASKSQQQGQMKRKKSRAPRLSMKPMQQPKTNVRSATFFQDLTLAKRRRNTFIVVSCFAAYSVYSLISFGYFFKFVSIEMRNGVLLWAWWSAIACLQWALWIMAYSWCATLPSMKSYAKMFPAFASHPLMRFPRLPRVITVVSLVVATILTGVFFFILPFVVCAEDLYNWVIPTGLTLFAAQLFELLMFQSTVFSLLLKMFRSFNASQRTANGGGDPVGISSNPRSNAEGPNKAFAKARKTVELVLVAGTILGTFSVVFVLIAAWTAQGRRNMYFFISAMFGLGALIVIGATYVIVYRISSTNLQGTADRTRQNGSMVLKSNTTFNEPITATRAANNSKQALNTNNSAANQQQIRVSDGMSLDGDPETPRTPKTPGKKSRSSNKNVNQAIREEEMKSKDSSEVQLG